MAYKRTILITGSTDGIGRQTAFDLAAHPDNFVILHGRTEQKCLAAKEYVTRENEKKDNVDFVVADFSSMKEVATFAENVENRFPALNVLLCNAGVLNPRRTESKDGLELTFQVNHLAPFVISRKLLPVLAKNGKSRLLFVSTICYDWHSLDFSDVEAKNEYEKYVQYSRTKLMNFMVGLKLSRDAPNGVTVNILEPGIVETKLLRNGGFSGVPVEEGSKSSTFCVLSPDLDTVTGAYFDSNGKRVTKLSEDSVDQSQQEKVWELSEDYCNRFDIQFIDNIQL